MANPDQIEVRYGAMYLLMELVNIDTLYYSLAMKTQCNFLNRFLYQDAELWFQVEALERFIGELGAVSRGEGDAAQLHNIDQAFTLRVTRHENDFRCEVSANHQFSYDGSTGVMNFAFATDAEFAAYVRDRFREFPKWW